MADPDAPVTPTDSLAERFWSVARATETDEAVDRGDPGAVVEHVLRVLDQLHTGQRGADLTVNTMSFLVLLRQQQIMGDLTYASPEQARGEEMDERSLVFSVGVLLFEKLTGRHPFGTEQNPRRLARMQKGELGSGVAFFPKIPEGLRKILVRAMGPFREERWETLSELRTALERFLAGAGPARPPATAAATATATPTPIDDVPTSAFPRVPVRAHARGGLGASAPMAEERATPPPPPLARHAVGHPTGSTRALTPPPPTRRWLAALLWMAVGAAATSVGFVIAGGGPPAPVIEPAAADHPVGAVVTPVMPPTPAAPTPTAPTPAASTPTPPPTPTPSPEPPPKASAPGTFDPALAGQRALENARACFTSARVGDGVLFGIGLSFGRDAVVRKVYYGAVQEITLAERRCVSQTVTGVSAGGRLPEPLVVEYMFHYRSTGADLKMKR